MHTQGPWKIEGRRVFKEKDIAHVKDAPHFWAQVGQGADCSDTEADANARLIAAAPELLEALEAVLSADPNDFEVRSKARAAIKKAKDGR